MMLFICPICKDELSNSENIYSAGCGHVFHQNCLQIWFQRSSNCPQCGSNCNNCIKQIHLISVEKPSTNNSIDELETQLVLNFNYLCSLQLELADGRQNNATMRTIIDELKSQSEAITNYHQSELKRCANENNAIISKLNKHIIELKKNYKLELKNRKVENNAKVAEMQATFGTVIKWYESQMEKKNCEKTELETQVKDLKKNQAKKSLKMLTKYKKYAKELNNVQRKHAAFKRLFSAKINDFSEKLEMKEKLIHDLEVKLREKSREPSEEICNTTMLLVEQTEFEDWLNGGKEHSYNISIREE